MEIATPCENEAGRLEALYALQLLDTPAEERFDRWTRLAQRYFDVPISLICLVDVDRQWFKSKQGLEATETERSISFCGHAIKHNDIFIIEDASQDPRFSDNPLVTDQPNIRFYAACPLRASNGQRVGTFCLIDNQPRQLNEKDVQLLKELAGMVEHELRQRSQPRTTDNSEKYDGFVRQFRSLFLPLGSKLGAGILSLICFVLITLFTGLAENQREQGLYAEEEKILLSELASLRGNIESALNAKLYLVQGLTGLVHANPNIDEETFQVFARELGNNIKSIRSLQLAPNAVVRFVWPAETNRKAIGHDLMGDPGRRAAAKSAIDSRKLWLAGPVSLLQGGSAIIGRQAIFSHPGQHNEKFWGFATVLVDMESLIEESGLDQFSKTHRVALRGVDASGNNGAIFFGDETVFQHDSVQTNITLPAGNWTLAALPNTDLADYQRSRAGIWLSIFVASFFISMLLYMLLRLPANLRRTVTNASAALTKSESRFKDAIDALPDGFVIYDADDHIAVNNKQLSDLYPTSKQSIHRNSSFDNFIRLGAEAGQYKLNGSVDDFVANSITRHQQPQSSWEYELGDGRWVHVVENRMRDGGKVGFHRDITELKQQQIQLLEAKQRAEQANQTKSQFLATVSHELRTPLNGVLGLLSMLCEDTEMKETQRNYAETAHDSARQLLSILNEILDVSKLEAGKLELDTESFSIVDTLCSAADLQRASIEQKGLEFTVEIDPLLNVPLRGDPGRIRQVLLNLLNNACKFTPNGEVRLTAHCIKQHDEGMAIQIVVSDTGIGFDQTQTAELFEAFTQLDNRPNRQFSGTGLGLAICQRLMGMMKGSIRAESVPGKGTDFILELRCAYGDQPITPSTKQPRSPIPVELGWEPQRILLAEDGITNQMVIQAMLKDTGYRVDIAHDGREAVTAMEDFSYDLVLMDVYMPNMDGLSATKEIRALSAGKAIPIIALTANAMPGDRERFIDAGMDDFMSKPVSKQDLLATLFRWLTPDRQQ